MSSGLSRPAWQRRSRVDHFIDIIPLVGCGACGYVGEASISPLFELAREAGEAQTVGAADRPHTHRPFLPIVPRRDQGFWVMIRGELAIRRGTSRHTLVFGGSIRIQTMMQSCASAAKLRAAGPILSVGIVCHVTCRFPPPRIVNQQSALNASASAE